jgi:2-keto-4-pentenoate hydratase
MAVDPRLTTALNVQLEERDAALADGARRVGWKLGMGDAERIGDGPAVGFLTSATRLQPGDSVRASAYAALYADVEIAVHIARDVDQVDDLQHAIKGYGPALELCDLGTNDDPPEAVVATNIFHRAFALGAAVPSLPPAVEGRLLAGSIVRASAPAQDLNERLRCAVAILATVGERLRAGDVILTGSIVQEPVAPGDELTADLGALGSVALQIVR